MNYKPWNLGNTTVRNPYRLQLGLKALYHSPFHGDLKGKEKEQGFAQELHDSKVVLVKRLEETPSKDASDVGRKWRAALSQLGFIVHDKAVDVDSKFSPNKITENGLNLLNATTISSVQECFLRALSAYYIPSVIESYKVYESFSPLRHVLRVMLALKAHTGSSHIYQRELGMFIQTTSSKDDIGDIVDRIEEYRKNRAVASNKKKFDREYREECAKPTTVKGDTLQDYADSNIRYLKATGLFHRKGRGIVIIPEKEILAEKLIESEVQPTSGSEYLSTLFKGGELPTDNLELATEVFESLKDKAKIRSITVDLSDIDTTNVQSVNDSIYKLEEMLHEDNERLFASEQKNQWNDIALYMDAIINRNSKAFNLINEVGEQGQVPKEEFPAYFEWVIWRAFLAINELKNLPYEARSFQVDQDFLPVNTAPGGKADAIFEFEEFVLVLEVTLTENSRQEAAEGEPVRRHVADYQVRYAEANKPVYGLFLANKINTNTVETFRNGIWYTNNDDKMELKIVPMTLEVFKQVFKMLFETHNVENTHIKNLLDTCLENKVGYEAPDWKVQISDKTDKYLDAMKV